VEYEYVVISEALKTMEPEIGTCPTFAVLADKSLMQPCPRIFNIPLAGRDRLDADRTFGFHQAIPILGYCSARLKFAALPGSS
jgi:hypothetical protein